MLQLFCKKVEHGLHQKMLIGKWMLIVFKYLLPLAIRSFLNKNIIYKIKQKVI